MGAELADRCMLVVAQEGDENSPLVAGALNLVRSAPCSLQFGVNAVHCYHHDELHISQKEALLATAMSGFGPSCEPRLQKQDIHHGLCKFAKHSPNQCMWC